MACEVSVGSTMFFFSQWITVASDVPRVFRKVSWSWRCGSGAAFDKYGLHWQSIDSCTLRRRFVVLLLGDFGPFQLRLYTLMPLSKLHWTCMMIVIDILTLGILSLLTASEMPYVKDAVCLRGIRRLAAFFLNFSGLPLG